jgi:hypothetical protein
VWRRKRAWRAPGTDGKDGGGDRPHHGAAAGRVELYLTGSLYRSVPRLLEVGMEPAGFLAWMRGPA